ncbi:MAG TPA: tetratricopeptide repeat protein [Balneolaceae bacterium]|nr:tetratricopeptide repeat protein [Balneolaceae bacterium]
MKLLKTSITTFLLGLFIVGLSSTSTFAQTKRDAVKTYNKALELVKDGKYEQAINMYNQALNQAKKLGDDGKDIVQRCESKLPQIYYQLALQKYRAFKKQQSLSNMDATIEAFQNTADIAKEYSDKQISNKATNVITQLLYSKSLIQYQQKSYNDALATLDKVISRNPNYANAYYQKGVVVKHMDSKNFEKAIDLFDKAIQIGQKTNSNQVVSGAKQSARDELIYQGAQSTEHKNYDTAIKLLQKALTYDSKSADAHYRLAEAYNKSQQWQKALDEAKKGLQYETGGKTDKAKIYYELATAYQGLGQKDQACSAYGNAAYGSFKASAEHQMQYELKCKSTTN